MAKLKIFNDIVDEEEKIFLQWSGFEGVCFKDINDFVSNIPSDDENIDLHLHCRGGSCMEGWAIYDALRSSGKKISATIEGECSSMATIILLSAPKERRFAQPNASICIHNPYVPYMDLCYADKLTAEEMDNLSAKLRSQADMLRDEQDKIINLYVERTDADKETLQALMNEDKYIGMDKAKELGFICDTLAPNTDSTRKINNKKKMNKNEVTVEASIFNRMLRKLGLKKAEDLKIVDMVITAANGQELTVERDEGDPQEGDVASPDGEFVMDDGTQIIVAEGIITTIARMSEEEREELEEDEEDEDEEDKKKRQCGEAETEVEAKSEEEETKEEEDVTEEEEVVTEEEKPEEEEEVDAKVAELLSQIASLEEQIATLKSEAKTEEESAILSKVSELGGMNWLNLASKAGSTFSPENRKFVEHTHEEKKEQSMAIGQEFILAKRAMRRKQY